MEPTRATDRYTSLQGKKVEELVDQYNAALQQAYDEYLDKVITHEQADVRKIHLFFAALGLPELNLDEVQEFRDAYKAVYRGNRRATPGSIKTLVRLREHGYRIVIITTNGQIEDQTAKAEDIGVLHLCKRIITSGEAGCRKPDPRIFQYAMEQLGSSFHATHMIGDSVDSDMKGGIDAQLAPILYSPETLVSQQTLFEQQVPIIHHMPELLGHFGIADDATMELSSLGSRIRRGVV
ncbi:hypothetical protein ACHAPU_004605 [Fusarium lateritium]